LYVNVSPGIVSYDEHRIIFDHSMTDINQSHILLFQSIPSHKYHRFALLLWLKSAFIMDIADIIDLTHPLESNMPVFPGSRPVSLVTAATFEMEGYHEIRMDLSTHTGTHVDCGYHLLNNGSDTLTTAVSQFLGSGLVADCRNIPAGGFITKEFLQQLETDLGNVDFLLIHTGWSQYWGKEEYFGKFPVLDAEAATYLSSFTLKGIGSDTISFDPVDSTELPVHHILLSRGLILVENLVNLISLPERDFVFSCFPLKIRNGDGSPVRAVGMVFRDKGRGRSRE
jgi:arylformamidase